MQWRIGGHFQHIVYRESRFNTTSLGGHTGPPLLFEAGRLGDAELSLLARGQRQWFANAGYQWAYGPGIEFALEPTRRLRVATELDHLWLDYDERPDRDGMRTMAALRPALVIASTSSVCLELGIGRERACNQRLEHWIYRVGIGYRHEFPYGFIVGIEPSYHHVRYDEPWPAFGTRRRDWMWQIRTELLNRRVDIGGFTPVLTYRDLRRRSTIELHSFDQHRVELGLTRRF